MPRAVQENTPGATTEETTDEVRFNLVHLAILPQRPMWYRSCVLWLQRSSLYQSAPIWCCKCLRNTARTKQAIDWCSMVSNALAVPDGPLQAVMQAHVLCVWEGKEWRNHQTEWDKQTELSSHVVRTCENPLYQMLPISAKTHAVRLHTTSCIKLRRHVVQVHGHDQKVKTTMSTRPPWHMKFGMPTASLEATAEPI
jgi:hypothetical protein